MYASTGTNKRAHPDDYRDNWDDAESLEQATAEVERVGREVVAAAAKDSSSVEGAAAAAVA